MNLFCGGVFTISTTKGVHSALLILLIYLSILRVETTSTSSSLAECEIKNYSIYSFDAYLKFMKELNDAKISEFFDLCFYPFENGAEILRFLGWSCKCLDEEKQYDELKDGQNLNGCKLSLQGLLVKICTQPSTAFSDLSDESSSTVKKAFMNLTYFHFYSNCISDRLISEIIQSLPNENFAQFMKAIYQKFSPESQVYVLKRIIAQFSESKLSQCSKNIASESIDDMFSEYQILLSSSSDNEIEIELLKSMLTSLFYEKLSNEFIKALPKNLGSLSVGFETEFPILIEFSQALNHFTKVDISLRNNYFDYSSSDLIQFLNTSKISFLRLNNANLTSRFFAFLKDGPQTDNLTSKAKNSEILNIASFENLQCLSLYISNDNFHKKVEYLKNLSSLTILRLHGSTSCLLFALRELKQIINLTQIYFIHIHIITDSPCDILSIKRNSETSVFEENDFDFESEIVKKINEHQMKILNLNLKEEEIPDSESKTIDDSTSLCHVELNYEQEKYQNLSKQLSKLKIALILQCTFNVFDSISQKNYHPDIEDFNAKSFITEVEREFYLRINSVKPHDNLDEIIAAFNEILSKLISDNNDENRDRKLLILKQVIEGVDAKYSELNENYLLDYEPLEILVD